MAAQAALLALDVAALEAHTERQAQLCQQLGAIAEDPGSARILAQPQECLDLEADPRWAALLEEFDRVQSDVRHQSRVHAALLSRARRSMALLVNVLASCSGSYSIMKSAEGPSSAMALRK